MKTMIFAVMLCAMAACATDEVPTSSNDQGLVCDPNCDPGNFQYLVSQVVGEANGLGEQVGSMECYHYTGGYDPIDQHWHTAHDECSATYVDPWGQQYRVSCSSLPSNGCGHYSCGQPGQLPC